MYTAVVPLYLDSQSKKSFKLQVFQMSSLEHIKYYFYKVYGLTLRSNQSLMNVLEISPSVDVWDVSIHLSRTLEESSMPISRSAWQISPKHPGVTMATHEKGIYLLLQYILNEFAYAEFVINPSGDQIWIAVGKEANLRGVVSLLFGVVLGCVLRIRSVTCLHASVVIIKNMAIALLGAEGAGKSTTTAALLQCGGQLFAEDVAALVEQKQQFLVQPGYQAIRLNEDAATQLYGSSECLQLITSNPDIWPTKKELCLLKNEKLVPESPVPLAAIYILEERCANRTTVEIQATPPITGLFNLVRNTYASWMLEEENKRIEFELLGRLAAKVPLKKVYRPDNLSMLPQISQAIIEDAKGTIFLLENEPTKFS
ncbi:hypothetical protein [Aerosakkonema funiforme]|uniref:hypothetical protein n=1 Tax=Aerosakkonema funiforme TaxID=1246630 RepID=UPI0035BC7A57